MTLNIKTQVADVRLSRLTQTLGRSFSLKGQGSTQPHVNEVIININGQNRPTDEDKFKVT